MAGFTRSLTKQQLYRLSGILFLLAAVAFLFSTTKWMAALEGAAGIALLAVSFRTPQTPHTGRRPPRRRGLP